MEIRNQLAYVSKNDIAALILRQKEEEAEKKKQTNERDE